MNGATRATVAPLFLALRDIKLAHTVFALPFALLAGAIVLPANDTPATIALKLALVIACMFFARTWAMLVNRIADARFDRQNARTATRAVASGALSSRRAWTIALANAALFLLAAGAFWPAFNNPWPAMLALPVLAFVALYSYTKRFTALCHIFLGAALAISPLAAAIAVNPDAFEGVGLGTATPAAWLALFVLCWVAGFDVVYALQDLDFDRKAGLHSIPAKLGWQGANWVSRGLHVASLLALTLAGLSDDRLGTIFLIASLAVAALLIAEHVLLVQRGREGIPMAFFTYNGIISLLLGLAGITDLLVVN